MKENDHKEMSRNMDKQGMRVFIIGTAIVYTLSLSYCYASGHLFETAMVGAVMIGLGIFIGSIYKKT